MKKLFNHTKKSVQDWDGYEENGYDWDGADEEAFQADQDVSEDWQEDPLYYGDSADEDGYYAGDGANYEEGGEYGEGILNDDEFYNIDDEEEACYAQNTDRRQKTAIWAKIGSIISDMSAMDRVIAATGMGVLVLAIVVGSVFLSSRVVNKQVSGFVSVGTQLEGIDTIGGAGLLAVADAQMAKYAAFAVYEDENDDEYGYDEEDYDAEVTVSLELVSIQKDLKIKFINKKTDRLIANVPFAVNVTDPDGKTAIWSDDDMDGIIYKKDITPGDYKVVMESLSDEKYSRYIISTVTESVEVRKTIKYEKVNVANEVKTEKEIDASQEDTKKNETEVESTLKDTVAWVESKVVSAGYNEVSKDTITNPTQLVSLDKTFLRATEAESSESSESTPEVTPSPTPEVTPTPTPEVTPTTSPSTTPTPETPTPTPEITLKVDPSSINVVVGKEQTAQATATVTNQTAGTAVTYSITGGDQNIAKAEINSASGSIKVTGVKAGSTEFTVTASCGGVSNSATLRISVGSQKSMTLDKTTATVFTEESVTVNATIANAGAQDPTVTAVSSDTNVAKVSVNKKTVTISGVKAGQATITISYTENGETVEAKCVVTVKDHPKNDTKTQLKDKNGKQIYVLDNGKYREAYYADYFTASKFYLMGEAKYTGWQTLDGKVYFFTADGKKVTGEQVIQGAKYNFASDGSLVTGSGALGIDVSKWNGNIDWNAVKNSGINYVIIRCGYRGSSAGSLVVDPKFTANIKGATAAGLKVGVYFFTQAVDEREAVEEASMVLDQIKNYKISYPVFLDVESSGGRADKIDKATRTAVCKAFCQTIQNAGYNAGIYANKSWLTTKLDPSALSAYKIWLAQYAAAPTYTGRYDLWQYRSTGSVSGISGNVDMNLSYLGY